MSAREARALPELRVIPVIRGGLPLASLCLTNSARLVTFNA
jgi:hypothetical protein